MFTHELTPDSTCPICILANNGGALLRLKATSTLQARQKKGRKKGGLITRSERGYSISAIGASLYKSCQQQAARALTLLYRIKEGEQQRQFIYSSGKEDRRTSVQRSLTEESALASLLERSQLELDYWASPSHRLASPLRPLS